MEKGVLTSTKTGGMNLEPFTTALALLSTRLIMNRKKSDKKNLSVKKGGNPTLDSVKNLFNSVTNPSGGCGGDPQSTGGKPRRHRKRRGGDPAVEAFAPVEGGAKRKTRRGKKLGGDPDNVTATGGDVVPAAPVSNAIDGGAKRRRGKKSGGDESGVNFDADGGAKRKTRRGKKTGKKSGGEPEVPKLFSAPTDGGAKKKRKSKKTKRGGDPSVEAASLFPTK